MRISPTERGFEVRNFECSACGYEQQVKVESF